jgi:hypothetical protein
MSNLLLTAIFLLLRAKAAYGSRSDDAEMGRRRPRPVPEEGDPPRHGRTSPNLTTIVIEGRCSAFAGQPR